MERKQLIYLNLHEDYSRESNSHRIMEYGLEKNTNTL